MKIPSKNRPLKIAASLAALALATLPGALHAQTVVSWGPSPDIINSNIALTGFTTGGGIAFTDSTSINPAANANGYYNGNLTPTGKNAVFYGGATFSSNSTSNAYRITNSNNASFGDNLSMGNGWTVGNSTATFVGLWNQTNFQNGFNTGNVTLASNNAWSLTMNKNSGTTMATDLRYVIETGSGYFVSGATELSNLANTNNTLPSSANATGTYATIQSGTTSALSWFNYDPATSLTTIGSAATPDLNNITAVGYWVNILNTAGIADQQRLIRIESLNVTAIPEPSAFAALAGLGVLALAATRRRRI